jgi:hypothetical protein
MAMENISMVIFSGAPDRPSTLQQGQPCLDRSRREAESQVVTRAAPRFCLAARIGTSGISMLPVPDCRVDLVADSALRLAMAWLAVGSQGTD